MSYYLGIDGGGTKTHFLLCDGDGRKLAETFLGTSSHLEIGLAGVKALALEGVHTLLAQVGGTAADIAAVGWGLPYYGELPDKDAELLAMSKTLLPRAMAYLCNDVEVGMAGSLALQPGVHIVAGTGAMTMAMNAGGQTARCGGWQEHFSDEGSAYWLGMQTLNLFTRQADGRLPKAALYHRLRRELGLVEDIQLNQYYLEHLAGQRKKIARIQLILEQAALQGDKSAVQVYRCGATQLFWLAEGAASSLSLPWKGLRVSYYGGVFKAGALVLQPLEELVQAKGGQLAAPLLSPAAGAALLAARAKRPDSVGNLRKGLISAQA